MSTTIRNPGREVHCAIVGGKTFAEPAFLHEHGYGIETCLACMAAGDDCRPKAMLRSDEPMIDCPVEGRKVPVPTAFGNHDYSKDACLNCHPSGDTCVHMLNR
jgi:hypothetical protein